MFKNYNDYKLNRKKIIFLKLPVNDINPKKCSVAIIIPHRNRIIHLKKFISHLESMKEIQQDNKMDVYVIDQNNGDKFNRGFLLNIGYLIAKKHFNYDRYIFHDVDSYPDNDLFKLYFEFIDYNIHFASPELGYKYTFDNFLGGVFGSTKVDYEKVNGFPNDFFGWGGEDDSFYNRYAKDNIKIYRPLKGSYILEDHEGPTKSEKNEKKFENILKDLTNSSRNGLRQLMDLFINLKKYEINDFISNYGKKDIINSESIQSYIESTISENNNYLAFKVDYLAIHTIKNDNLLNKDFIQNKINKKLELYKGQNYFQHPTHPEIISLIEPLINIDEINDKIFKTYTKLKPFILTKEPKKRELVIKNLVKKNFEKYNTSSQDLFPTIKFIFETFNELIYFRIRDNKLECAYHLYNLENNIDWLKNVKTVENKSIDEGLIDIMNSQNKSYYTLRKPHFLPADNCLINFDSYSYLDEIHINQVKIFKEMIEFTINKFKNIPDSDILINPKEFPLITKDHKYAYNHLLVGDQANITSIKGFYFFGSQSIKDTDLDIPIPLTTEWNNKKIKKVKWDDKKPIAFYRHKLTGCGQTIETNTQLKLADLSYKWSKTKEKNNLIDVGITSVESTIKIYNQFIGIYNINKYDYLFKSDHENPSTYKYIFNINSNKFNYTSVVLNIESDYHYWFEPLLKDGKQVITIKSDFSDLSEKLNYLNNNDDQAKNIANNGYKFNKKYMNKDMIATFWFYYMFNINELTLK